jgi:deoxyribonuclease V
MWPTQPEQLVEVQQALAIQVTEPWVPGDGPPRVAACWVCFPRGLAGPGAAGDQAWAAVVAMQDGRVLELHTTTGRAGAAYTPGLLALRAGALLETVVETLAERPDVLLLDGTGRDHPRRCASTGRRMARKSAAGSGPAPGPGRLQCTLDGVRTPQPPLPSCG